MKAQAIRTADQVRPVASTAREVAAHRIEDARVWAAPKLDRAAHSVEEQLAPKVSALLSQAAEKIDPAPSVRRRGRWSTIALLAGFAACAVGIVLYRNNARQWADSMKDTSTDAGRWSGDRMDDAGKTDESGGRVDEASRRMY
jgi:ferric-dicitrate binding protein FerR (iron transport regulator)